MYESVEIVEISGRLIERTWRLEMGWNPVLLLTERDVTEITASASAPMARKPETIRL